jgi:uncharacterized membrane protein
MDQTLESESLNALKQSTSRKTALIAVLAALCIGTNYVMLPLPNINLMDAIVFTTGLFYGFIPGASIAAIAWLVYGSLNPLGFSAPILLMVIGAEMIYALVGSRLQRTSLGHPNKDYSSVERYLIFGVAGLFATLAYDIMTNAVSGLLAYNSIWLGLITMNVPLPLGIIHAASNFVLFATITPLLLRLLAKGVLPKKL